MSMAYDNKRPWRRVENRPANASWDRCSVGAVLGLAGGIAFGFVGALLTASAWFEGTAGVGAYLRAAGTVLFVLMFPMLIFGAHCLDLTERRKKAEREGRFKEEE